MSEPADTGQAGTDLARITTSLDDIARMGLWLAAAESGSRDAKAQGMAAALRMAYASSLGLPLHAASEVYLIQGNLTLSAKLCRALAHSHGITVERVDVTPDSCTAVVIKDGKELGRTTFTLAQAAKMGLRGDNWTRNPDRMLWARASKRALDDFAPWVTVGILSTEQAQDSGLDVNNEVLEGEVVDEDGKPFEDAD